MLLSFSDMLCVISVSYLFGVISVAYIIATCSKKRKKKHRLYRTFYVPEYSLTVRAENYKGNKVNGKINTVFFSDSQAVAIIRAENIPNVYTKGEQQ